MKVSKCIESSNQVKYVYTAIIRSSANIQERLMQSFAASSASLYEYILKNMNWLNSNFIGNTRVHCCSKNIVRVTCGALFQCSVELALGVRVTVACRRHGVSGARARH